MCLLYFPSISSPLRPLAHVDREILGWKAGPFEIKENETSIFIYEIYILVDYIYFSFIKQPSVRTKIYEFIFSYF